METKKRPKLSVEEIQSQTIQLVLEFPIGTEVRGRKVKKCSVTTFGVRSSTSCLAASVPKPSATVTS